MSPNPYVFVVGCARSGTTLLQRMLDSHPMLAVANDTHFIPEALRPGDRGDHISDELYRRVAGYRRIHRLELSEAQIAAAADGATDFAGFVSRLYDAYGAARGKALAGEKTPEYVRHIPMLAALFPEARFIHIVRDGRDVALSVMKWAVKDRPPDEDGVTVRGPARRPLWSESPLAATALWWSDQVMEGAEASAALGPRVLSMRYERLVADPSATLTDAATFLGLPDAPEMAAYHEGRRKQRKPGKSAKKAWLPATRGLRDWRSQMEPRDAALFEALAGEALTRFGYPLETGAPDETTRRWADHCRAAWAAA